MDAAQLSSVSNLAYMCSGSFKPSGSTTSITGITCKAGGVGTSATFPGSGPVLGFAFDLNNNLYASLSNMIITCTYECSKCLFSRVVSQHSLALRSHEPMPISQHEVERICYMFMFAVLM